MSDNWPPVEVAWPAVLVYGGKSQLAVVDSQDEWDVDPSFHKQAYQPDDRLVDSDGREYRLTTDSEPGSEYVDIVATGAVRSPAELYQAAERHLEAVGSPVEWLEAYLADMAEKQWIRAIILYITRHESGDGDGEEE